MGQLDLFDSILPKPAFDSSIVQRVNGLSYLPGFLSSEEHDQVLKAIDASHWLDDLKRRVQHYGYKYDYKKRSIDKSMFIGQLPSWAQPLIERLVTTRVFTEAPDQIIVNEYLPGQGIANHIDCEPCFGNTIVSISLGSPCIMDLCNRYNKQDKLELLLDSGSLIGLADEARYKWTHGIPARRADIINGVTMQRSRRVSLTFRKVIL